MGSRRKNNEADKPRLGNFKGQKNHLIGARLGTKEPKSVFTTTQKIDHFSALGVEIRDRPSIQLRGDGGGNWNRTH